jgi:hypothetical protein
MAVAAVARRHSMLSFVVVAMHLLVLLVRGAALHPSSSSFTRQRPTTNARITLTMAADVLYDVPVSNHGARVRFIIYEKQLAADTITIAPPTDLAPNGLKSPEYLALNPQGKMPLLVAGSSGWAIPESDTICRYLLDKHPGGPSFVPPTPEQRSLCEQIVRTHDVYLTCLQGAMYKAPGTPYSVYGQDRMAALSEFRRQLTGIDAAVTAFEARFPHLPRGPFLCGDTISLADATLYPTAVFAKYMLPQFFQWKESDVLGPRLTQWYHHLSDHVPVAQRIQAEILAPLEAWKANGRWNPILAEINQSYH